MCVNKKKEIYQYIICNSMFCLATFACCYQNIVRSYNATMLALSYQYGFTSRSLLGTIYHVLNNILPIDMMNYQSVLRFAQIVTGLFFLFLMGFTYFCISKCREDYLYAVECLLLIFNVVTVATFSSGYNFFRVDMFMLMIAMISAWILISGKAEWLVIPLSCVGVMFHQGFVFMYFNVALVLLLYRFFMTKKKKYIILFAMAFMAGSALFLWFEFFSRTNGEAIIDQVISEARMLAYEGKYHSTLIAHEVLGIDLSTDEFEWHKMNIMQMSCFVVLIIPYIVIAVRFFKGLLQKAIEKKEKLTYAMVIIGAGTMLPDFILKIDYGRWVMAVIAYYVIVLVALVVLGDQNVGEQLQETYLYYKNKSWGILLLMYVVLLIPLWDVDINGFTQQLSAWLNGTIFDWYHF